MPADCFLTCSNFFFSGCFLRFAPNWGRDGIISKNRYTGVSTSAAALLYAQKGATEADSQRRSDEIMTNLYKSAVPCKREDIFGANMSSGSKRNSDMMGVHCPSSSHVSEAGSQEVATNAGWLTCVYTDPFSTTGQAQI